MSAIITNASTPSEQALSVGDKAPDFELTNVDGKLIALNDYSNEKGVIVIFTCNQCPFSKAYEDRIIDMNKLSSKQGYPVVAINPNDKDRVPEDSFENMKIRSEERGFNFPYLYDADQSVATSYGASRTPHVFLLTSEKSGFRVAYIGAIDDNVKDTAAVTEKYVENAIKDLEAGKPIKKPNTKAIGCTIKWKS